MIRHNDDTLSYDAKNRLTLFEGGAKREEYTYNHAGLRIKKKREDDVTVYSIGGLYQLTRVPNRDDYHTYYIYGIKGDLVAQRTSISMGMTELLSADNAAMRNGIYSRNATQICIGRWHSSTEPCAGAT